MTVFPALLTAFLLQDPPREPAPTFGVSACAPRGWGRVGAAGENRAITFAKGGKRDGAHAFLNVELVYAEKGDTLAGYAGHLAKTMKAETFACAFTVDGHEAVWLKVREPANGMAPKGALVTRNGDWFYVVSGFSDDTDDCASAIECVAKSIRFSPFETPSKHLSLASGFVETFPGVWIRLPESARPYDVDDPKSQRQFGIYDHVRRGNDFFMTLDFLKLDAIPSRAEWRKSFATNLQNAFGLEKAPEWNQVSQELDAWITNFADVNIEERKVRHGNGLLFLSEREIILATFTITVEGQEEREAYEGVSGKIMGSFARRK